MDGFRFHYRHNPTMRLIYFYLLPCKSVAELLSFFVCHRCPLSCKFVIFAPQIQYVAYHTANLMFDNES